MSRTATQRIAKPDRPATTKVHHEASIDDQLTPEDGEMAENDYGIDFGDMPKPSASGGKHNWAKEADDFINSHALKTELLGTSMTSGVPFYGGSIVDADWVANLQAQLLAAGYIHPTDRIYPGHRDQVTRVAMAKLLKDATGLGFDPLDYLSYKISIGGRAGEKRAPFVAPERVQLAEGDIRATAKEEGQDILGRFPNEEQLGGVVSERRRQEDTYNAAILAEAKARYSGGAGGVTVTSPEDVRAITRDKLSATGEAKSFHAARLGLALIGALRGGL